MTTSPLDASSERPFVAPTIEGGGVTLARLNPSEVDLIGVAALMRTAYSGASLQPIWRTLGERLGTNPEDAAALMDMATVLMLTGQPEAGLQMQAKALARSIVYRKRYGRGDGPRVLAFVGPGDLMANTPLDFLLEGSDIDLWFAYLDEGARIPTELPEHDVAVMAVGEAPGTHRMLMELERALNRWPCPVVNGRSSRVAALTRDGVASHFVNDLDVLAPEVRRLAGQALTNLAGPFPIIARPVGSHAGRGLAKLDDRAAAADYCDKHPGEAFYVSPFVDYASPDGLYRKQRIAFVDGRPFVAHMAISDHWMVHYLSANMAENEGRRFEEERFMANFDTDFAQRHAAAFHSINARLGLDYFSIDCAEAPDGRLLLFEADVAMIVHALDPDPPFGYKRPVVLRLFRAVQQALQVRAEGGTVHGRSLSSPEGI